MVEIVARAEGVCGELVLRRRGPHLELVCGGTFLVSTENEVSSRALIAALRTALPARPLDVLLGGLGLGHALDEALDLADLRSVTVVELEPAVVDWFYRYGGERAARAAADGRVRIVLGDVAEHLGRARGSYDVVALDTDNGPGWLVRPENEAIYSLAGMEAVLDALRRGGLAAYWVGDRDDGFTRRLERVFGSVSVAEVVDVVGARRLAFAVYVCRAP